MAADGGEFLERVAGSGTAGSRPKMWEPSEGFMYRPWGPKPLPVAGLGALDGQAGFGPPGTQAVLEGLIRFHAASRGIVDSEGAFECWMKESLPQLLNILLQIAVCSRVEPQLRSGAVHMLGKAIRYEENSHWMALPRDARLFVLKQLYKEVGEGLVNHMKESTESVDIGEIANHAANAVAAVACAELEAGRPQVLMTLCPNSETKQKASSAPTVFQVRALAWVVAEVGRTESPPSDHLQIHIVNRFLQCLKLGDPALDLAAGMGLAYAVRHYPSVLAAPLLRDQVKDAVSLLLESKVAEVGQIGMDAAVAFVDSGRQYIGRAVDDWALPLCRAVGSRNDEMVEAGMAFWESLSDLESASPEVDAEADDEDDGAAESPVRTNLCGRIARILDTLLDALFIPDVVVRLRYKQVMAARFEGPCQMLSLIGKVVGMANLVSPLTEFIIHRMGFDDNYHQETAVFLFGWIVGDESITDRRLELLVSHVQPTLDAFVSAGPGPTTATAALFATSRWATERLLESHPRALLGKQKGGRKKKKAGRGRTKKMKPSASVPLKLPSLTSSGGGGPQWQQRGGRPFRKRP